MRQLQLRRELRAVVPLELPPRQKFLLRDEGLRHHPEERRRRQHDLAVVLRWPAMAATGGGRRHPAGLHSRSDASAEGPPLLLGPTQSSLHATAPSWRTYRPRAAHVHSAPYHPKSSPTPHTKPHASSTQTPTYRPPAARTPAPSGTKAESGTLTTDHPPPPFFSTPPVARRTRLA